MADLYLVYGFVAVMQNERGTGDSEGNFTFWKTAPEDGQDTMEWIVRQPWSNGKVSNSNSHKNLKTVTLLQF